jgi:hypothetical protein
VVLGVRSRTRIIIVLAQLAAPPSRTVAGEVDEVTVWSEKRRFRRRLYLDAQRKSTIYSFAVRSGSRWYT